MVEVGSRELKARLSYYLRLMEAGETIAIKIHNRVVGFLSQLRPPDDEEKRMEKKRSKDIEKRIRQLKKEGFLRGGGKFRCTPFEPVKMTPGPSSTELLRKMRDEE